MLLEFEGLTREIGVFVTSALASFFSPWCVKYVKNTLDLEVVITLLQSVV